MSTQDISLLFDLLQTLPFDVVEATAIHAGSNNRLYRLVLRDGSSRLLKQYFQDDRRRLYREWNVFTILHDHDIGDIPKPIYADTQRDFAVYEFIEGHRKLADQLTRDDLAQMAGFIAELHQITPSEVVVGLPPAIMAATSIAQIVELIRGRIQEIKKEITNGICYPMLASFLQADHVLDRVQRLLDRFQLHVGEERYAFALEDNYRRLTPTDFGPHNMIFRPSGEACFVDFEYSGWDHPMRVLADFVNHDRARGISASDKDYFIEQYLERSPLDPFICAMLPSFRELARIEWLMIYVSSMNQTKLAARRFSNPEFDEVAYLSKQIQKTKDYLERIDA